MGHTQFFFFFSLVTYFLGCTFSLEVPIPGPIQFKLFCKGSGIRKKNRKGCILWFADVRRLVSGRYSENSENTHPCKPALMCAHLGTLMYTHTHSRRSAHIFAHPPTYLSTPILHVHTHACLHPPTNNSAHAPVHIRTHLRIPIHTRTHPHTCT